MASKEDDHVREGDEIERGLSRPGGAGYDDATRTAKAVILLDKSVCKLDAGTRRLSVVNIWLTTAIFALTVAILVVAILQLFKN